MSDELKAEFQSVANRLGVKFSVTYEVPPVEPVTETVDFLPVA